MNSKLYEYVSALVSYRFGDALRHPTCKPLFPAIALPTSGCTKMPPAVERKARKSSEDAVAHAVNWTVVQEQSGVGLWPQYEVTAGSLQVLAKAADVLAQRDQGRSSQSHLQSSRASYTCNFCYWNFSYETLTLLHRNLPHA